MARATEGDAALMTAFARMEPDAARQLYDRYASRIYGLGLFLLRNNTDAEDLVQDTFLKIWRMGSAFDPVRGSLDGWILLSARSLAIDLLRHRSVEARKRSSQPKVSAASDETGPEWHAEVGISSKEPPKRWRTSHKVSVPYLRSRTSASARPRRRRSSWGSLAERSRVAPMPVSPSSRRPSEGMTMPPSALTAASVTNDT